MAYSGAHIVIVWGDAAVVVRAGVAELATFVCRSSSDMTCSDYTHYTMNQCVIATLGPKPDVVRAYNR